MNFFLIFDTHFQSLYILSHSSYGHHGTARQSYDEAHNESVCLKTALEGEQIGNGDIYHYIRYEYNGHQHLDILQTAHNTD